MKTAETKTSSSAQSKQGNKPFFGKEGDSFFEKPVQAKLSVGKTNDRYEKEADSMADKVVQRLATGEVKNEEEQKVQTKPENLSHTITPLIQQKCEHCEEEEKEKVQRKPIFESEAETPVQKKCDNAAVPSIQPKCKHCEEEEKHQEKEDQEDGGAIQRVSCRECEEGNKVLMKPMPGVQRAEEDQTPKNDGSRASILAAAQGELGKVHARTNDGTGRRVGADRLNEYFKIAAPDVWDESIITTAGVEMPSWCGIFSVWAHKKAGKNLGNWQMGKGVSAFGTLTNTANPQPGDIGYIHKQNQHHAVVKEIQGDNVITIDGNSGVTSEVKENTKPRSAYTLFMTAFGGGGGGSADVQKKDEEHIQSKSDGENATASSSVEDRISQSKGGGSSLPENMRQGMEQSFSADFSNVRIHTGGEATQLSHDLRAQAFTHGSDIYFNSGKYSPDSDPGKHLLAHELTHVVQQNGAGTPAVQKKEAYNLCDQSGKNRPKSVPSASSLLMANYTHLAKVINSAQLEKIQKMLDTQYKIAELNEKMENTKVGSVNADNNKYRKYEQEKRIQESIQLQNNNFYVDSKLLAADEVQRPPGEDNEGILAFHEQLYKRFCEFPVRIKIEPCFFDESNPVHRLLIWDWMYNPPIGWRMVHTKGLVTFKDLLAHEKTRLAYSKATIGAQIEILERMLKLIRIIGDSMFDAKGKKLGEIWTEGDVKIGEEIGSISGYIDDPEGYMSMYKDLMSADNAKHTRVVLLSEKKFLHIFALDPNFDTTILTSPTNDDNLYVLDKGRAAGINVYQDHFFTKDQFTLKYGGTSSDDRGWSTKRILSEYEEFAIGAIFGDAFETDSGMALFGQIVIGMVPIVGQVADARDVCVGIHKMWTSGAKDGKLQTGLAMVGFVPVFGDWIKRAARVGKSAPDVAKAAAKTDAVVKGSQKMGDGVSGTSANKIKKATDDGAGKKGAKEALENVSTDGKKLTGEFVDGVMKNAGEVTDESAANLIKSDKAAKGAAEAHGRQLADLQNPKVLAESSFKIGDTLHSIKVVEIGSMKQLWICSTCGSLVGKIDEVLETASGEAAEKLRKLRDSAADLERKVTNGDIKPRDVDKKVGRITFELNDLARKNPQLEGLTKLLREDLERQYKLVYKVDDIEKLSDGAKAALAKNYRPTPPGYHWRLVGDEPIVVRNPDNVPRSKLKYEPKEHRFVIDEEVSATAKRFDDIKAPEALTELKGKDLNNDFRKFVKTIGEELGVPEQKLIDDLAANNAGGFKGLTHDAVRHKLKGPYVEALYARITDAATLANSATYKRILASTNDPAKAFRAASHEELMRISGKLGSGDKGSLGERWMKEFFASRDEVVSKQIVLGPEHGVKHFPNRRIDLVEGELAREVKNVAGPVGMDGTKQLEDLMAGVNKDVVKEGVDMSYDSVRWVFVNPEGVKANAGWMVEQLGKYKSGNLSFQVFNKVGMPKAFLPADLDKFGADKVKKMIEDWANLSTKAIGIGKHDSAEMEADAIADKIVNKTKPAFFGAGKNANGFSPFFSKNNISVQRKCETCAQGESVPSIQLHPVAPTPVARQNRLAVLGDGTPANRGMTFTAFEAYTRQQGDWFAEATLTAADRTSLWFLVNKLAEGDHILAGSGDLFLSELVTVPAADWPSLAKFGHARYPNSHTLRILSSSYTLAQRIELGSTLTALEAIIPPAVLELTVSEQQLNDILANRIFLLLNLQIYWTVFHPHLQFTYTPAAGARGPEFQKILDLINGAGFAPFFPLLGRVRNIHRFSVPSLQKLMTNFGDTSRSKPVHLVLHTGHDERAFQNAAFLFENLILNSPNLVLMLEGAETLAGLTAQIPILAHDYGQPDATGTFVLGQVMIAGHGSARSVQLAGTGAANVVDGHVVYGNPASESLNLDTNAVATQNLLDTLIRNMNPATARIVYAGCLVGANPVPATVPPANIPAHMAANPSLGTYTEQRGVALGRPVTVEAARASVGLSAATSLTDPGGNLHINYPFDPNAFGNALTYVATGREPEGVMRAAVEVAVNNSPVIAANQLRTRLGLAATEWWGHCTLAFVQTALDGVPAGGAVDIGRLNLLANMAETFFLARFGMSFGINVNSFVRNVNPHAIAASVYPRIVATPTLVSPDDRAQLGRLVIEQGWLNFGGTRANDLISFLDATPALTVERIGLRLNTAAILTSSPLLFPPAAALTDGRIRLALAWIQVDNADPNVKAFLDAQVINPTTTPELSAPVKAQLGGIPESEILERLGRLTATSSVSSGGSTITVPNANAEITGDTTNDVRIERQSYQATVTPFALNVRRGPSMGHPPFHWLHRGDTVQVAGFVHSWAAVDINGRLGFVFRNLITPP